MRENNKEKLFAQTFSLLLTRNIGDLTLDEVEKATGFTRGAIFYYAKTKLDFFRQVIINEVLEKQDIHRKVNYTEGMSLKDFIQAYLEGVVHTRTYYLDAVSQALPENPTHAYLLLILQIKRYYPDLGEPSCRLSATIRTWENAIMPLCRKKLRSGRRFSPMQWPLVKSARRRTLTPSLPPSSPSSTATPSTPPSAKPSTPPPSRPR